MTLFRRPVRAFTLIELLVVITIIGLLAGLAVPAIFKALEAAKKAQASAMINQVRVALTAYQTEYGTWPDALQTTTGDKEIGMVAADQKALYRTLIAYKSGTSYPADNARGIAFMEFNGKDLRANFPATAADTAKPTDSKEAACFVDPWNHPYFFKADSDYDNEIAGLPGDTTGATMTVNASLVIWSRGPQKTFDGELDPKKNYLRSWR
jgi:prepilin-type N-terminal cleavage/methylation domain-containing protein